MASPDSNPIQVLRYTPQDNDDDKEPNEIGIPCHPLLPDLPDGSGPRRRLEAYRTAWGKVEGRIYEIAHALRGEAVNYAISVLEGAYEFDPAQDGKAGKSVQALKPFGELCVVLLGGTDIPAIHNTTSEIRTSFSGGLCSVLTVQDCSTLMGAMKALIAGFIAVGGIAQKSVPPKDALAMFDINVLVAWWDVIEEQFDEPPNLLLVLPPVDNIDPVVLNDLLSILAQNIPRLPIVVLTSSPGPRQLLHMHKSAFHSRVTYDTMTMLDLHLVEVKAGRAFVEHVLEKALWDPHHDLDVRVYGQAMLHVLDYCKRYNSLLDASVSFLQLAYLHHFANPYTVFMQETEEGLVQMPERELQDVKGGEKEKETATPATASPMKDVRTSPRSVALYNTPTKSKLARSSPENTPTRSQARSHAEIVATSEEDEEDEDINDDAWTGSPLKRLRLDDGESPTKNGAKSVAPTPSISKPAAGSPLTSEEGVGDADSDRDLPIANESYTKPSRFRTATKGKTPASTPSKPASKPSPSKTRSAAQIVVESDDESGSEGEDDDDDDEDEDESGSEDDTDNDEDEDGDDEEEENEERNTDSDVGSPMKDVVSNGQSQSPPSPKSSSPPLVTNSRPVKPPTFHKLLHTFLDLDLTPFSPRAELVSEIDFQRDMYRVWDVRWRAAMFIMREIENFISEVRERVKKGDGEGRSPLREWCTAKGRDARVEIIATSVRNLARTELKTLLDTMNDWLVQLRHLKYPEYPGDTVDEKTDERMDIDVEGDTTTEERTEEIALSREVSRLRVLLRDGETEGEREAKKLAKEFAVYIEDWFAERCVRPAEIPLQVIWELGTRDVSSDVLNPAPHSSVLSGLLNSEKILRGLRASLQAAEEDEGDEEEIYPLDTTLLYERYLESGRLINVFDWFESFGFALEPERRARAKAKAITEKAKRRTSPRKGKGKAKSKGIDETAADDNDKEEADIDDGGKDPEWRTELQTRFLLAMHELDFLGFLRGATGAKAKAHVAKVSFDAV